MFNAIVSTIDATIEKPSADMAPFWTLTHLLRASIE